MRELSVGELARRTGLTVRTLHHYDRTGLLRPGGRTAAGHRRYGAAEVERLQRITSLRRLGLSLEEIGHCLGDPGYSLPRVLEMHAARLEEEIEARRLLRDRLRSLGRYLDARPAEPTERILQTIEAITMYEKYYTPEQLETLRARREALGDDGMRAAEAEWPRLIAAMRAAMRAGTDPADPEVRALASRWRELVEQFTGGDPGIARSLGEMYRQEPEMGRANGLDPELMAYVGRAQGAG